MSIENERIYTSLKIPELTKNRGVGVVQPCKKPVADDDDGFYEIEYDGVPIAGVGKFVKKPLKIEKPQKDETRELFRQMRDISQSIPFNFNHNRFFDKRVHEINAAVFYKQAVFMKDFSDNYEKTAPLSQYFPFYQHMGYEQLRTYFTWRTAVRSGKVADTSLSYAFLYIYELLDNIGVSSPTQGLDRLMSFWKAFREYNQAIDKYMLRWLKDYHVYYELPHSFRDFISENELAEHYPELCEPKDCFSLFCSVSKYNIRKSGFFADDKKELVRNCFNYLVVKLRQLYSEHNMNFDETVFQPTKKMPVWTPFSGALFYPCIKQRDRKVILSEKEIYICKNNEWSFSTVLTNESGKALVGCIMKQMETALRKLTKYKYKLSSGTSAAHPSAVALNAAGISLEDAINRAVIEFYREATKIVVEVDAGALSRIRQEALLTQEKLIIPERNEPLCRVSVPKVTAAPAYPEAAVSHNDFDELKTNLTETELNALKILLSRPEQIKRFADEIGIMLEVLCDGINEKAMDAVGDNLLDDELCIYDDYIEQIKEMVEEL